MANFVFVHGSWFGGWCWDRAASMLRESGHHVLAEDLPGHGQDTTPFSQCTLDAYVDSVCSTIEQLSAPVVLVGHSMGGIVISGVAERLPTLVSELVYVAAYLPRNGESIRSIHTAASEAPSEHHSLVRENMVPAADWSSVDFRREGLKETFLADCAEEDCIRASALIRSEPTAAFGTPAQLTAQRFGAVAKTYIRTTRDRALTPTLQHMMLASTPCTRVADMDTGHCPMLAAPARLVTLLEQVIR